MLDRGNVFVVIPALNEELRIREVVTGALEHAEERNEAWDNDPRFNDPDEDEDEDGEEKVEGAWGPFRF